MFHKNTSRFVYRLFVNGRKVGSLPLCASAQTSSFDPAAVSRGNGVSRGRVFGGRPGPLTQSLSNEEGEGVRE